MQQQQQQLQQQGTSVCSCRHLALAVPERNNECGSLRATTTSLRQVALEHFRQILIEQQKQQHDGSAAPNNASGKTCAGCWAEAQRSGDQSYVDSDEEDILVCLHCLYIGCRRHRHVEKHFVESNHFLGFRMVAGEIFCFYCGDYIYDVEFELARKLRLLVPWPQKGNDHYWDSIVPQLFTWRHLSSPSLAYAALGLRGLYNLGNTCFMNSVLQAVLHNPLLQRFFLSRSHSPASCVKAKAMLDPPPVGPCLACELQSLFLAAFSRDGGLTPLQDPYDPLVPHRLLHAMWSHASGEHLAGYEQQDAHEFFIALIDAVSTDLRPPPPTPSAKRALLPLDENKKQQQQPSRNCPSSCPPPKCDIQAIFQGTLRSDVICSVCKHASTVYEPFNDLSLPLERSAYQCEQQQSPSVATADNGGGGDGVVEGKSDVGDMTVGTSPPSALPSSNSTNSNSSNNNNNTVGTRSSRIAAAESEELTVDHCLESYTALETLSEPYNCEKCGCARLSSKQLTIHRLPEVLVLHLKRFDARKSRKIERFVQFPAQGLDLSHYLYLSRAQAESNARAAAAAGAQDGDDDEVVVVDEDGQDISTSTTSSSSSTMMDEVLPPLPYDLFAMVEHRGTSLQQGHYKASVREGDQWFTCNDTWVTLQTEEEILKCQGYLLFYIKRPIE